MKKHAIKFSLSLMFAGSMLWAGSAAAATGDAAAAISRGEYLATASDCAACHTDKGGLPFAGGLKIESPVGTIIASNITPSLTAGIGHYTEQQFADAVRKGIRADGANLYPAMPYTAYSVMTDQDIHDLYQYFMQGVKPVDHPAAETELPFPMNIRMMMKAWNLLFLNDKPFSPDASQSAAWNRGKYLVTGAAHCSTCHTPRGPLMEEESSQFLSGGQVGAWYAPNITSDPQSGIGRWSQADIVQYLRTGNLPGKAQAAGSMGEAVEHSFQHLTDDDLNAIATYIRTVKPVATPENAGSRFMQGDSHDATGKIRGLSQQQVTDAKQQGLALFQGNCASCHEAGGQGSRDSYYPSLFHNSVTGAENSNNLIATILNGVNRTTRDGQVFMPGFGHHPNDINNLTDEQIASLANYVLTTYGKPSKPVTAAMVATVRQGGPGSSLVLLARFGIAAGVVVVLILLGFWVVRRKKNVRDPS
ncbi:c-type cytochrome [Tatumella citrea]|uniref:Cytochrome C n=1 Tax=Tatumella citrea TaxID=53336 RepID=A0A1Y0LCQ5_TATCI|nr:cytochrome c [Tatumella citrea]ARU95449.1 cytochrome C [Tatumella citrea]ARU99490.1 cytochrome C [Tatumella citrea]